MQFVSLLVFVVASAFVAAAPSLHVRSVLAFFLGIHLIVYSYSLAKTASTTPPPPLLLPRVVALPLLPPPRVVLLPPLPLLEVPPRQVLQAVEAQLLLPLPQVVIVSVEYSLLLRLLLPTVETGTDSGGEGIAGIAVAR